MPDGTRRQSWRIQQRRSGPSTASRRSMFQGIHEGKSSGVAAPGSRTKSDNERTLLVGDTMAHSHSIALSRVLNISRCCIGRATWLMQQNTRCNVLLSTPAKNKKLFNLLVGSTASERADRRGFAVEWSQPQRDGCSSSRGILASDLALDGFDAWRHELLTTERSLDTVPHQLL